MSLSLLGQVLCLIVLIPDLCHLPYFVAHHVCGECVWSLFCIAVLSVLSSFAIISQKNRELVALLCVLAAMGWFVIVAFPVKLTCSSNLLSMGCLSHDQAI